MYRNCFCLHIFSLTHHNFKPPMMIALVALTVFVQSVFGGNLVEVLQNDGETTLISLVKQAGLADALLSGILHDIVNLYFKKLLFKLFLNTNTSCFTITGEYTIFAPTNAAFSKLPQSVLDGLQRDTAALANILKYHVVKGSIHKADASNELQLETLAGTKIRFNIYNHNHVVTVEGSKITHFDLTASNGMVHVIDTVMMPPSGSIVDLVAGNSDLSTLLSQVQSAGLAGALQGDALTVFAPTNAAFNRLGSHVLNNLKSNPQLLKEILEYHVVPHTEYSAGLYNREHLATLDSHHDVIRLGVSTNGVVINHRAHVTKADISATNGVVHIIDHPPMMIALVALTVFVQSVFGGNLVEVLQNDGETTLISLVKQAGLADALLSGEYTIFAPTNAAFSKLPQSVLDGLQRDTAALANILKYHVVKGSIHKADASNELQLETLAGTKIRFNIYNHNHVVTVEGSKITHFDLTASNGMVHVIDTVMMPPSGSIVDLVAGNSDLSTLLSQVQSAGLAGALQGDALTVFAPTNAAFNRLGSHVLNNLKSNPQLLKEILEYHVVPHTEYSAGLYNREHLATLDSHHDVIRLGVSTNGVVINHRAHVTKADISATNGVVHIIDHVLIPARHIFSSILGRK
ncbi:transforming growth factor-beta-induced protein ig-h3-like [Crassostrea angulata]|uniref:transforming growth factor-beta-induced protein ig-h3-like n=2 Tax=Magallana angulata TaxID=2784310 RepID=UPI0022B0D0EB|nr:transforming growth factor-beta-induced protein ig-h3-like [Crassostrea angulata]XP_052674626.1 transforming growth factor-beta-induced protein ig-h3-like [Crassostrea angulata]